MLVDPNAPFFRHLWVRILCVIVPLAWTGVELCADHPFWAVISAAAGLYLAFELFLRRKPD